MNVAHASISNPQACSPAKGKGHQCTKETQKISQAQLRANKAWHQQKRPCDARVINPKGPTPNTEHALHTPALPIPTPTHKPEHHQRKRQDHNNPPAWIFIMSVFFFHSWYMNPIDREDLQLWSYTKLTIFIVKKYTRYANKQRKS